jgi:hypothetical protein
MATDKTIVIRGELYWAKIVGDARPYTGNPKYDKGPSWSVDITPDAKSRKIIEEAGIADKLRVGKSEKETRKESFLTLRILENGKDGKKNKPPKISDIQGRDWDDRELGNSTIADIKVKVKDYGDTVGAYYQEARILKLVPYEGGGGFTPLSEDDEFFGKTEVDDIPFDTDEKPGQNGNVDDLDDDYPE